MLKAPGCSVNRTTLDYTFRGILFVSKLGGTREPRQRRGTCGLGAIHADGAVCTCSSTSSASFVNPAEDGTVP